jgi:hypothetical protein
MEVAEILVKKGVQAILVDVVDQVLPRGTHPGSGAPNTRPTRSWARRSSPRADRKAAEKATCWDPSSGWVH